MYTVETLSEKDAVNAFLEEQKRQNKKLFWKEKRTIDILFACAAILLFSLPMAIIYLLIFISDGSDPIFRQTRIGRHGVPFKMYKFRTMVPDAEQRLKEVLPQNEMDGPVFKLENDPRITKVGKFLRATSLDELPQFFNVLKGDMSIIGPRPPLPSEVEQYNEYQKLRLSVTPGITCIWQVQPRRNTISFDKWVEMDLDYILHRSSALDIKILFATVLVMLRKEGR